MDFDELEVDDEEEPEDVEDANVLGGMPTGPPTQLVSVASPAIFSSGRVWNPHFIKGKYRDTKTMAWHQVLVIILPSGIGASSSTEDIDVGLEADGTVFVIHDVWPEWITNRDYIYFLKQALLEQSRRAWKDLDPMEQEKAEDEWHDSFACMACALQEQMALMHPDPKVPTLKSTARIKLDFAVQPITSTDWLFVGNDTGVRMLFVDLKAPTQTSYEAKAVKDILLAPKPTK
jgi:hypothetical protein